MNITSINRGNKQTIKFNGEDVVTGIFKSPVENAVHVSHMGIDGDIIVDKRFHGGTDQAIYLYSSEDYAWWAKEVGDDLAPGTFGENLTTQGLDITELTIGDRLTIGEVELEITAPRTPCFKLATRMDDPTFPKKFVNAARPGAYARVLKEGTIKTGDEIVLEKTNGKYANILDVFNIWHGKDTDPKLMQKILASPTAALHKQRIQEMYDKSITSNRD